MPIPVVVADFANNLGRTGAASGGLGFGYQYNSWLRTDFEIDRAVFRPSSTQAPIWCPSGTVLDYPAATRMWPALTDSAGYLYDPNETCTPYVTAHLNRTTPMFNAYIDLGNWWGFTPYVGAGVGISYLQSTSRRNLLTAPRTVSPGLRTSAQRGCLSSGSPLNGVHRHAAARAYHVHAVVSPNQSNHRHKKQLEILLEPDGRRQLRHVPRTSRSTCTIACWTPAATPACPAC